MKISNEFQLLILATVYPFEQKDAKELEDFIRNHTIDWQVFRKISDIHFVTPLVYNAFYQVDKQLISPDFYKYLYQRSQKILFSNLDKVKEFTRVVELFKSNDIPLVAYKGAFLAMTLYNNVSLRMFSDFDFLIQYQDITKIKTILEKEGYVSEKIFSTPKEEKAYFRVACEYNFDFYEKGMKKYHLEPHWMFISPIFGIDIKYDDIIPYTQQSTLFNTEVSTLHLDFLPIMMSIHHGGKDFWSICKHISDWQVFLGRYGNQVDWARTKEIARKFDVENLLYISLALTNRLYQTEIPRALIKATDTPKIQKLTDRFYEQLVTNTYGKKVLSERYQYAFHLFRRSKQLKTKFKIMTRYLSEKLFSEKYLDTSKN